MVIVTIVSGPRTGQRNLGPMEPEELFHLAKEGWRWEVDYASLSSFDGPTWAANDLSMKVLSALRRGGKVRFLDQVWFAPATDMDTVIEVAKLIEGHVSTAGCYLVIGKDTESFFEIMAYDQQQGKYVQSPI